jgi:predicted lipid-binding transport protein (Tim44 family)
MPEQPQGEILLQSPPLLPKGSNSGVLQLMSFLPMMLGMGAMSFVYIGRGGGAMTWVFGALFVSSMAGMIIMTLARAAHPDRRRPVRPSRGTGSQGVGRGRHGAARAW